uniref:protein-arginine deiminase n=1 Tax=Geotrypetes seraphini TaxID=260995 RepID=A0A6P8P989_GEOSA|nr:protein-arginine deiminase type-1-like isoform X2 [Geotrypetes seraphini]
MSEKRTIQISWQQATYATCVVGTKMTVDVYGSRPPGATSFDIRGTPGVHICIVYNPDIVKQPSGTGKWPLTTGLEVLLSMPSPSDSVSSDKVKVSYYGAKGKSLLGSAMLYLTSVVVSLDVDTDRNGLINKKKSDKTSWTWGSHGHGAILLVNCDKDNSKCNDVDNADEIINLNQDLKDMSCMILRTSGPDAIFASHKVILHISPSDSDKVGVFHAKITNSDPQFQHVLGRNKLLYEIEDVSGEKENTFFLEGLRFPDADFSGLITVGFTLLDCSEESLPNIPVFTDLVVFRVAPWIMTPNTLEPEEVFVCRLPSNIEFLDQLTDLVKQAQCKLTVCEEDDNRGDRWIQDEMEFGYTEGPDKCFPVVFDSPRNGGLKDFPFKKILGPDFGYVKREPASLFDVSSLDYFGNLEVSPPVTVKGRTYPLGRILIGSNILASAGRRMNEALRDFLFAQQVQAPVELYVDWLLGFRLLLASPTVCYQLFQEKKQQGFGDAAMFQGINTIQHSIDDLLSNELMKADNDYVQRCINWNRNILKAQLGLTEQDIIDVPALFYLQDQKALGFFPVMVNMIVLGKYLGIPKPFGPVIEGKCCLEEKVVSLLEPLGLSCTFLNDFASYHQKYGDVHCGTNVRRQPFDFKWWHMRDPLIYKQTMNIPFNFWT